MKCQRPFLTSACVLALFASQAVAQEAGLIVRMMAFSPDGKSLVVGAGAREEPGRLTLWDVAERKPRWVRDQPKGVSAVRFTPDGKTLLIAAYEPFAKLLDAATGQQVGTLGEHTKPARTLALSPDGKILAISSFDETIQLWELATRSKRASLHLDREFALWLAFSPDGSHLLSCGNKEVRDWDVATGQVKRSWKTDQSQIWCALFSRNGQSIIMGDFNGSVSFWDPATGELRRKMRRLSMNGVHELALDPAAKILATCTFSKTIDLYYPHLDQPTDKELERIDALLIRLDDDDYGTREQATVVTCERAGWWWLRNWNAP